MRALISQRECVDTHGTCTDVLEADYVRYFEKNDVDVWAISNFTSSVERVFEQGGWDFVILTGGGSVPKEYYDFLALGEPQQKNRDRVEKIMIQQCLDRDIPILAICRGMQFLNGMFGGKISKLNELVVARPIGSDHEVWCEIWEKRIRVNNFHNDGIRRQNLAKVFSILAEDQENQIVEGFYSDTLKIYAMQWHPERRFYSKNAQEDSRLLVREFINRYVRKGKEQ